MTHAIAEQSRLAAVILAAGRSQRMGRPKMLLPLAGTTLLGQIVRSYLQFLPAHQIFVVTGNESAQVAASLESLQVKTVENRDFASGEMLSSVTAGIRAAQSFCDHCFVALGDQPFVRKRTLASLIASHLETGADVSRPSCAGRHGHPLLIAARGFQAILDLPASQTLKTFVGQQRVNDVLTEDASVLADVDTPSDYQRLLLQIRSEACSLVEVS